jgi:hypothetical protein
MSSAYLGTAAVFHERPLTDPEWDLLGRLLVGNVTALQVVVITLSHLHALKLLMYLLSI